MDTGHVSGGAARAGPPPAEGGAAVAYRFAGHVLDPRRAELRGPGGAPVELRPKSFDVLHHLLRHAGQVVPREALLDAVWPGVTVGEEAITQCVRDVRRALGEAGPRVLRTLPRRGYMLDAPVERVAEAEAGGAPPVAAAAPCLQPLPGRGAAEDGTAVVAAEARLVPAADAPRAVPLPRLSAGRAPAWALALLLAAAGGAALGVWATRPAPGPPVTAAAPPAPAPSPREEAERLTREGIRLLRSQAGAPAWLTQRELFRRAVEADPSLGHAWAGLAFTYTNMLGAGLSVSPAADLRAAEAAVERALALAPGLSDAHAAHCAVLRRHPDRLEEALAACRRALDLSPAAHPARANLGWISVLLGRPEEGAVLLRTSIAAEAPDAPLQRGWHHQLGLAELVLGRGDRGVANLRRDLGAAWAGPPLALAAALALNGRVEEAGQVLAEARGRWPGLTVAGLRADPPWPSRHPAFLAQLEPVFAGLELAGLR